MHPCRGHCRNLLPHMTDFLEGDAGDKVCRRIERHMIGCEKCRMYVDTHRRVIHIYHTWRDAGIPKGAEIRLKKRLREELTHGKQRGKRR